MAYYAMKENSLFKPFSGKEKSSLNNAMWDKRIQNWRGSGGPNGISQILPLPKPLHTHILTAFDFSTFSFWVTLIYIVPTVWIGFMCRSVTFICWVLKNHWAISTAGATHQYPRQFCRWDSLHKHVIILLPFTLMSFYKNG